MKFLMKGKDTVKGQDVFWHAPEPDPQGLRYTSPSDLDTSTIEVLKKTSDVTPDLTKNQFTAGESISKHDALYYDTSDDKVYKATSTGVKNHSNRLFIGLADESGSNGNAIQVITEGDVFAFISNSSEGDTLYVSSTTAGNLTLTNTGLAIGRVKDGGASIEVTPDVYQGGPGAQYISSLSDLPPSPSGGDLRTLDKGGGNLSSLVYDASLNEWVITGTGIGFSTIWNGSTNPWTQYRDEGQGSASYSGSKLQANLTSDAQNTLQVKAFSLPVVVDPSVEVRVTCDLGGSSSPGTGTYRIQPRLGNDPASGKSSNRIEYNIISNGASLRATDSNGNQDFDSVSTSISRSNTLNATISLARFDGQSGSSSADVGGRLIDGGTETQLVKSTVGPVYDQYYVTLLFRSEADVDCTLNVTKIEVG